ncbi:MAG: YciI family protein [Caulobacteraceae bacterium]
MPHFVVEYFDRPDSGEVRAANRAAHIEYRKALGPALVLAGPLFEDFDGSPAKGSLVILEAADKADAEAIAHRDPYAEAGAFQEIRVFAHRILVLNPPAKA